MKQFAIAAILGLAAAGSAAAAPAIAPSATARSVDDFGTCFVAAQERASLAWSFVPNARGGTFSNLGAKGVTNGYFLVVSDRGSRRELRLEPATAAAGLDARVVRAVARCA
jgi:hypothetical protein